MSKRLTLSILALAVALGTVLAGAELILRDGRAIPGTDVRREGNEYVVVLEGGDTIVVPVELVDAVRLTGEPEPEPERVSPFLAPPAVNAGAPQDLAAEIPEGPSGLVTGKPETLAGNEVTPPRPHEMLEVLGPPAGFQRDIVNNDWVPTTDWDMDPSNNNFAPSRWAKGPIDPSWQPQSAFDPKKDVLAEGHSKFPDNIIDNEWKPTDGFANSVGRR